MNLAAPAAETTFRFTSIEPLAPLNERLEDIASENGCEFQVRGESIVNAPFCGIDYHVEDVRFSSAIDTHVDNIKRCIAEFSRVETEFLADGYFEIIG